MKFLDNVRNNASFCRQKIGISPTNLLQRIENYITQTRGIELAACDKAFISGGKAELRPLEGLLYYDEDLNSDPYEKLWVIAHELGHIEQHGARLTKLTCHPDPIYNQVYSLAGKDSLARYNPRSLEEVEANTFAAEFLCPSEEVFKEWYLNPDIKAKELAEKFGSPVFLVRSQLANALYQLVFGNHSEKKQTTKEFKFNCSQIEASEKIGVPVLVDAGPGTGKTATLVRRIEFLLSEKKVAPSSILVLTFSNEACNELYERIATKFDEATASQIRIATFHGFGLSLLQFHGQFKDMDNNIRVLDEAGQRGLVNEVLGELHNLKILKVSNPETTVKEVIRHISFLKERMISPESLEESIEQIPDDEKERKEKALDLLRVYKEYEKLKDSKKKLDFADLIQKSSEILDSNPKVKEINRKKYQWVLVDEYQDVSRATAIFLQNLCGEDNPPWVVGDKRQSIFRFCGANPENMDKFSEDFPNAEKSTLNINYRSSEELVDNKNTLANLINNGNNGDEVWKAAPTNPISKIDPVISFAVASSDEAERVGIVDQIQTWIDHEDESKRVAIKDIAVLARRNVDVRNIVLALSKKNIPAVASGLVTAEGAAGDLANIITFADYPVPSIPRLVYCLGKDNYKKEDLDILVTQLLENFKINKELEIDDEELSTTELFNEIKKTYHALSDEKFNSDAFAMICIFLFESSNYLRRLLDSPENTEKSLSLNEIATTLEQSLALNEIVTTLTQAATYRFSHQKSENHLARKDFAKFFRESLSQSTTPTTSPPSNLDADAVKVMTAHASKGLEFPYVVVAGQTLSEIGSRGDYNWLPTALCPDKTDDLEQSDSTLFVGVTRAKEGLTISYAETATGLPKSRKRKIVPLLKDWTENKRISATEWNNAEAVDKDFFDVETFWGGRLKYPLKSRNLDNIECSLAKYLQDGLKLRFPVAEKPLYPIFYVAVREALGAIVKETFSNGGSIDHKQALKILSEHWNSKKFRIDENHIHHQLYWNLAQDAVKRFADIFVPENGQVNFIDLVVGKDKGQQISLDLACAYTLDGNSPTAIFFRPESLKDKLSKKDLLLWGGIKTAHRNSFILLREDFPNLEIKVFSGEDGVLYDFHWGQERFVEGQRIKMLDKQQELSNERFIGVVPENTCNYRCDNRINCPHWIGAL